MMAPRPSNRITSRVSPAMPATVAIVTAKSRSERFRTSREATEFAKYSLNRLRSRATSRVRTTSCPIPPATTRRLVNESAKV